MGAVKQVKSVHTQFEYATWYYQYLIESSIDGVKWNVFADKSKNTTHGSPMIDIGNVKARYLRITILDTEYPGLNKAIWNFKAFANDSYNPKTAVEAKRPSMLTSSKSIGLLVDLDTYALEVNSAIREWPGKGKLGGRFLAEGGISPSVEMLAGRKAVVFSGTVSMTSDIKAPQSMLGNSSFTVSTWVYNESVQDEEPIVSWTARGGVDITNASIGYGSNKRFGAAAHWGWPDMAYKTLPSAGKWHHIAVIFDGTYEKLYVDGVLDHQELKMLFIANLKNFMLGTNADKSAFFSGAISSLKIYDVALTEHDVIALSREEDKSDVAVYLDAGKLDYGILKNWKNEGYLAGSITEGFAVGDLYGKIAVILTAKDRAVFSKRVTDLVRDAGAGGLPYSIVSVLAGKVFGDEKWHHVASVFSKESIQTYVDGVPDDSKRFDKLFITDGDFQIEGVASIVAYNRVLEKKEIGTFHHKWKASLSFSAETASFEVAPTALSPGLVNMSAAKATLPGNILQYLFTATDDQEQVRSSGWVNNKDYNDFGVSMDRSYSYSVKLRDSYGNVTMSAKPIKVSTNAGFFDVYREDFNIDKDYLKETPGSIWDGLMGKADVVKSEKGILTLSSTDTKWDESEAKGPFLYKNTTGDFVVQVEVVDVSGLKEQKTNGANDVGLMVCAADGSSNLVQNSVFPGWGVGNMVTNLNENGRFQFNNAAAWSFFRHLQVQRSGNVFYLRGSSDGKDWKELPGSPVVRTDLDGETVKVGLFQCTYGVQSGYGSFKDFKLFQKK
jgi:hypothetical protein